MINFDWTTFTEGSPPVGQPLLLVVSRVKASEGDLTRFTNYMPHVREQLCKSKGLVGVSMRVLEEESELWSVSVWEDFDSVQTFLTTGPHGRAREHLSDMVDLPHFAYHWFVFDDLTTMPLSWEEVEGIIKRVDQVTPLGGRVMDSERVRRLDN